MSKLRAPLFIALSALLCVACGTPKEIVDKMEDVSFKPPFSTNPPHSYELERIMPAVVVDPPSESFALPAPSEVLRESSAAPHPRFQDSMDYIAPASEARLQTTGDVLSFQPDWSPANPEFDRLAYATFQPNILGYSGPATVYTEWLNTSLPETDLYVALANFELDRWQWFRASYESALDIGSFDDYATLDGDMLVVVALTGSSLNSLSFVRVGTNSEPEALLEADTLSGNAPLDVSFDASGSSDQETAQRPLAPQLSYAWDLDGNGSFEIPAGPSPLREHTYNNAGSYNATVRVTDSEGGFADALLTIEVSGSGGGNLPPTAVLGANATSGNAPLDVEFDASGSSDTDGSIVEYDWDFLSDGTYELTTTEPDASFEYSEAGIYSATLRVRDDDGAVATDSLEITVGDGNDAPQAELISDFYFIDTGSLVQLDASGSTDINGDIERYEWDLDNDGNFEIDGEESPLLAALVDILGNNPFSVRVTDAMDNSAVASVIVVGDDLVEYDEIESNSTLETANALPLLGIQGFDANLGEAGYDGSREDWYSFIASENTSLRLLMDFLDVEADLDIQLYDTDGTSLLDSSTGTDDQEEIIHAFTESGIYFIRCFVYSGAPADAMADYVLSLEQSVIVPPTASFTATPENGASPLEVLFDASASSDTDGSVVLYEWDFNNDGTFEQNMGATPTTSATFYRSGSSTVTLRVTDDSGASATASRDIVVSGPQPNEVEHNDSADTGNIFPSFPFSGFVADLGPGGYDGDTDDWYRFTLAADQTVELQMNFFDPFGDLDMKLYRYVGETLTEVGTSTGTDNDELISMLLTADTYYLNCYVYNPTGGGCGGYHLAGSTL